MGLPNGRKRDASWGRMGLSEGQQRWELGVRSASLGPTPTTAVGTGLIPCNQPFSENIVRRRHAVSSIYPYRGCSVSPNSWVPTPIAAVRFQQSCGEGTKITQINGHEQGGSGNSKTTNDHLSTPKAEVILFATQQPYCRLYSVEQASQPNELRRDYSIPDTVCDSGSTVHLAKE